MSDGLGVDDGVGVGVGEGDGLGDCEDDGFGTGDGDVAVDLTEVTIMDARLITVVVITTKMGISAGISSILSHLPLRCLKNSTCLNLFSASWRVLYGPPKLRPFSESTK